MDSGITPVEAMELVNTFYSQAWQHLMWFLGVGGAISVIGVPWALERSRRKAIEAEMTAIREAIESRVMKEVYETLTSAGKEHSASIDVLASHLVAQSRRFEFELAMLNKSFGQATLQAYRMLEDAGTDAPALTVALMRLQRVVAAMTGMRDIGLWEMAENFITPMRERLSALAKTDPVAQAILKRLDEIGIR
jgi:hypothetical protein